MHVYVCVTLVLFYGAETWSVTQQDIRRLKMFQVRCLRDIVTLDLWDMRCNVDILEETGELPIKEQLRLKRFQGFEHLERMPDHWPQKPVETERKEQEARKDLLALGECHQQKPIAEIPEWQEEAIDRSV